VTGATAAEQVERILSVLPWIVETPGSTVEQVCNRFGMQEQELRADLDLLMYEVGIHPFTPDARVDVIFDGERIFVHLGDYFRRPLRLTADEAVVLYAAGQALLDRPGPDPVLTAAVAKLGRVLGDDVAAKVGIRLADADPDVLSTVRGATDLGHRLSIDYYSFGRDQRTTREVDPITLVAHDGHWYLTGWCRNADGLRRFRVDRITRAVDTGVAATPPPDAVAADGDSGDGGDIELTDARSVVLTFDRAAEWIIDTFPTESVEELDDGRLRVTLRVAADAWLQRLLLQIGPRVEVTDAATGVDLRSLASDAAARLLRRYG